MVTFIKLKSNGYWGVKVAGEELRSAAPGVVFQVTKRSGETKAVTLVALQEGESRVRDLGYQVWSIAETRPAGAYRGGRGAYRPRGEQASFASQNAPYELADQPSARTIEIAERWTVSGGFVRDDLRRDDQPTVEETQAAMLTNQVALDEDPAETFKRLLAGTYTPGESSVRDARGAL
jgi:hypothetical protein